MKEVSNYLKDWFTVIEGMSNDNTYKLAWSRAIVEICVENDLNDEFTITFDMISKKILKYYWNQIFFFNLKQSHNKIKLPVIYQITKEVIDEYIRLQDSPYPKWYDKAEIILKKDPSYLPKIIKRISTILRQDVCHRFMNVSGEKINLYELNRNDRYIKLLRNQHQELKDYGFILIQLLNYKWAQLLEQYNHTPKIASKVKGLQESEIRRGDLKKYKNELLKQFDGEPILDFYTGKVLDDNNISIDHVIPWSFIYSDDIWNLVITSKSINSSKSNSVPSEEVIHRLKERNKRLIYYNLGKKYLDDLRISEENNLLDKFYIACKS